MTEPRQKTAEEIQDEFLRHLWHQVRYWASAKVERETIEERLAGLAFGFLNMLDGTSMELPAFLLIPSAHPTDPNFRRERGEDWYPVNEAVERVMKGEVSDGDMLHEKFYQHPDAYPGVVDKLAKLAKDPRCFACGQPKKEKPVPDEPCLPAEPDQLPMPPEVERIDDLRRLPIETCYACVREDGYTYVRSTAGEVPGGWSKIVPA